MVLPLFDNVDFLRINLSRLSKSKTKLTLRDFRGKSG